MTAVLVPLIIACGAWAAAAAVLITREVERHGIAVDLVWWRMRMLQYLSQYRQVTLADTRQVGPPFYHFVVPLSIALVLVVLLLLENLWR